jgi:hypothetical protein
MLVSFRSVPSVTAAADKTSQARRLLSFAASMASTTAGEIKLFLFLVLDLDGQKPQSEDSEFESLSSFFKIFSISSVRKAALAVVSNLST